MPLVPHAHLASEQAIFKGRRATNPTFLFMLNQTILRSLFSLAVLSLSSMTLVAQDMSNFTSWTQTQDPAHPLFTAAKTATDATLSAASGSIPAGTDIGFTSVNRNSVAQSSSGFYFSAGSSFNLAIDYDLTVMASAVPTGLFIGFGIGEDGTGVDSAGITLGYASGFGFTTRAFAATARANDSNLPFATVDGTASQTGTFFVSFDHLAGNVTVGAADSANASSAGGSHTFTDIAQSWNGDALLASFFMRSDTPTVPGVALAFPRWSGNTASAVFSNFRILAGTPTAVPEPAAFALFLGLTSAMLIINRRRR